VGSAVHVYEYVCADVYIDTCVKIRRGRHARVDTYAGLNMHIYIYKYMCMIMYVQMYI